MKLTKGFTKSFLLLLFVALMAISCKFGQKNRHLAATKWMVEELSMGDEVVGAPQTNSLVLEFLSDSTFGATTLCNSISGEFAQISDSTLWFSTTAVTSALCPDDNLESIFLEELSLAAYFGYAGDTLLLSRDNESLAIKLLPFKKQ